MFHYCLLLLLLLLGGTQSAGNGNGGLIILEPTFWEERTEGELPGYTRNGEVVSLYGEIDYMPGADCCAVLEEGTPWEELPSACQDYCDQSRCNDAGHSCFYTRFGNGDCCEAGQDTTAIDLDMIDTDNCPCATCGEGGDCIMPSRDAFDPRGLIGFIENKQAYPTVKQVFPVSNDVGVQAVVEVDVDGRITLAAWSIPVGHFNPGQDGGTYWYLSDVDNPLTLSEDFSSNPDDRIQEYTDELLWQYVSLDGISYVISGSSRGEVVPNEWNIDILQLSNQYQVLMLVLLVSLCGFCVGIGLFVAGQCCKCKRSNKYSRVKVVDYNDTETE